MAQAAERCEPGIYFQGLDAEGIDVAILSPTTTMALVRDDALQPDHAIALCRVYNDWAAAFCKADPHRFKFWGFVATQDASLAAQEARRSVEELGAVGVAVLQGAINGRLWSDECFAPLWDEMDRLQVPLGFHVSFSGSVKDDLRWRYAGHPRAELVNNMLDLGGPFAFTTVAELIMGGVLEEHPTLQPVIMESCASWLPWLLWRLDEKWETFGQDVDYQLSLMPSEYWKRQGWAVVECEEAPLKYVIDYMGDEHLLISTDFPHHDAPWPDGIKNFVGLDGISDESKRKILWDNGARLFGLRAPVKAAS
jgi:predicted TIM-barrel fold metal-dependent hydrolase